jgi:hypothetical protein
MQDYYTTIAKVANDLGVSKEAVRKKMKSEPLATNLQTHIKKNGNLIQISETGEYIIKSTFNNNESPTVGDNQHQHIGNLIDTLSNQLYQKDKQIEELTKILSESQKLNENNQILLKQSQDRVLELEMTKEKKLKEENLFKRLFKK